MVARALHCSFKGVLSIFSHVAMQVQGVLGGWQGLLHMVCVWICSHL